MVETYRTYYESEIGLLEIEGTATHVTAINFVAERDSASSEIPAPLETCVQQLTEYFVGTRHVFTVPLAPAGTPFQQQVWQALATVPFGEKRTYAEIARQIGHPEAYRAVGNANGRNKISVILPCHRIVGSDGKLTGYGGGLWRKEWLLQHEQTHVLE